ncbi:MAG: hypothetical protein WC292_02270 [Clostridia bacterium]
MQKNPFIILGVAEDVTQNQLYEAYRKQRDKYMEKRFAPGDEGTEACEMLDRIEAAYREADGILKNRHYISDGGSKDVEELIREGRIDEAQEELDKIKNRNAEWHYFQSMIFFRKKWYNEAHEQMRTAMELEPHNSKYREAYERLNSRLDMAESHQKRQSFYNSQGDGRSYRGAYDDGQRRSGCTPCDCCTSLLCADCCCECMGGDLISCC